MSREGLGPDTRPEVGDDRSAASVEAVSSKPSPGEWVFFIVCLSAAGFFWLASSDISSRGRVWPMALAAVLAVTVCIEALARLWRQSQRRSAAGADPDGAGADDDARDPSIDWTTARYFLGFVALAAAAYLFGFVWAIAAFGIIFMLRHGYRGQYLKVGGVAVALTLSLYVLFDYFARVPLTAGLLLDI